jgi:hypothetical protein
MYYDLSDLPCKMDIVKDMDAAFDERWKRELMRENKSRDKSSSDKLWRRETHYCCSQCKTKIIRCDMPKCITCGKSVCPKCSVKNKRMCSKCMYAARLKLKRNEARKSWSTK